MSRPSPIIEGFDYATHKPVTLTLRDWQCRYPATAYRRRVENGETFYTPLPRTSADRPRLAAEAYGRVP